MKTLFIVYVIVMAMLIGYSKSAHAGMSTDSIRSYVYCVEGYKFLYVFTSSNTAGGVSVTQILKYGNGNTFPMACDGTEPKRIKRTLINY